VAVSAGVAEDLAQLVPANKTTVIYNPIIPANFQSMADEPIHLPWPERDGYSLILGVGRLEIQKDFPTLIEAFKRVSQNRSARLLILGDGTQRGHLEKQIERLELANLVALPGFVQNPYPYMQAADVFVLSSRHEGLSNTLVEAMATGTPVLSTDCPHSPREILEGGKYGILAPVGDPAALAEAILQTLDNPQSPQLLMDRSMEFTAAKSAERYIHLFETLTREGES
jgi:glycosyltransferase involved in cell wall biosynthesis